MEKRKKISEDIYSLQKENENLKKQINYILEATGDGVWEWDPQNRKTNYSKRWAEIIGYTVDELTDSDEEWSSRVHSSDLDMALSEIEKNMTRETAHFVFEYKVKHKNGHYIPILNRGAVVERDDQGRATKVFGSHTDLSEKSNQELANQQTIHFLQNFFDLSIDFLCVTNQDGTFKKVNDSFIKTLGYHRDDFIGTPFVNFIHKDDLQASLLEFEKSKNGGLTLDFENRYRCKDGRYIWLSWRSSPDPKTGDFFCIARNVTRKKEYEREIEDLKSALNQSAIVATTDPNGCILAVNNKFCEISKYSRKELIGKNHQIVNSGFHSRYFFTKLWDTLAKGKTWKGEIKNKAKDGIHYWVATTIIPFTDDHSNKPYQYIAISNDITTQKSIKDELIYAKEIAELSVKSKELFLANMSHEIRTPMNGIIGYSDILLKELKDPDLLNYAQYIKNSSENLMLIINDILDFSKLQENKVTIENSEFSLSKITDYVQNLFYPRCKEKGIRFTFQKSDRIPEYLIGDGTRLGQILINLVGNAVKFTGKGEVALQLDSEFETATALKIRFSVRDSGIGIAEDKLESIFESFNQATNETTRKYGGTGLGLTITRRLIELQKGKLSVNSTLHQGSEFSFILAFEKSKTHKKPMKHIVPKEKLEPSFLKGKKILLAEDNQTNQQLISHIFKIWGSEIDIASNGKIAVEKISENDYDLVLMDVQMPIMDGNLATRYIRENLGDKSEIPIIALTAHATLGEEQRCLEVGMDDYLSKPFEREKLLEKIHVNLINKKYRKKIKKEILDVENFSSVLIDMRYLSEVAEGDATFISDMIQRFLLEIPEYIEDIKIATIRKNKKNLGITLHKLKSIFGLLGLGGGLAILTKLEEKLSNKPSFAKIEEDIFSVIYLAEITLIQVKELEKAPTNN
jgi:PAS domain S-box-containing protein